MEASEDLDVKQILIDMVYGRPMLYNKSLRQFREVDRKKAAWEEIAAQLSDISKNSISADKVQRMWDGLKKDYSRERAKLKAYIPSGSELDVEKLDSSWPYFKMMMFLEKVPNNLDSAESGSFPKTKVRNINQEADLTEEDESDEEDDTDTSEFEEIIPNTVDQYAELQQDNDYFRNFVEIWNRIPDSRRKRCCVKVVDAIESKIAKRST